MICFHTKKVAIKQNLIKWNSASLGDLTWHGEDEIAVWTVSDNELSNYPAKAMFDSTGSQWHSGSKTSSTRSDNFDGVTINFKV